MANQVVELEGRGTVTLSSANHLATGGEASVYRSGDTIVKVYLDQNKMARDGMVDKVALLRPLKSETIVAPEGVAFDKKTHAPVGFYMGFVAGEPMPRVFTTSFWQRTPFDMAMANALVEKMRATVQAAHAGKAVMVDANELNWLASVQGEPVPHVIDVDSWAIGKWQAQVIMQSIRDWHTKGFTKASDWFSWAVVTFQIYTGIHPYRGTLDGYKPSEWERRMKDNASVFAKGVRLNAAVRDLNGIPGQLRSWYEAAFQRGERTVPPSPFAKAVAVQKTAVVQHVVTTGATGALVLEKIFDGPVQRVWPCGAVLSGERIVDVSRKRTLFQVPKASGCEVVRVAGGWVMAALADGAPRFWFADESGALPVALDLQLSGHALFRYADRLFLATDTALLELGFVNAARPTLAVKQSISILHPQATRWFDGVGVEKAFGATFAVTPFGESACATVRVPELDGLEVVAAKSGRRFAAFLAEDRSGDIHKIELTFDENHASYKAWTGGADSHELNMAALPKGVCATIVKDGELVIFVPSNGAVKRVQDATISTRMELGNIGDTVVAIDGGALWSLKLR